MGKVVCASGHEYLCKDDVAIVASLQVTLPLCILISLQFRIPAFPG